ncbi:MAG: hypothetical protein RLN81_09390 [Balneolaceae bacterium]
MFNQDFIMRQIQQMTQVLNKILIQVLNLRKIDNQAETLNILNRELIEEVGFDIDEILSIKTEAELISFIKKTGFNTENLNILADILFEVADQGLEDPDKSEVSIKLFSMSLELYEYIEKSENIYSIDRNLKISMIKNILN